MRGLKWQYNPEQTFSSLSPLPPSRQSLAAGPARPTRRGFRQRRRRSHRPNGHRSASRPHRAARGPSYLSAADRLAALLRPRARRPTSPGPAVRARAFSPPLTPPCPPRSPAPRRAGAARPLRAQRAGEAGRAARRRSPQGRLHARTARRQECGERRENQPQGETEAEPQQGGRQPAALPGTCGS